MRLACPSCHATYEIPDALLAGGGRKLRCARCAAEWVPVPPSPVPAPVPPAPREEPSARASLAERAHPEATGSLDARSPMEIPDQPAPAERAEPRPVLSAGARPDVRAAPLSPPARRVGAGTVVFAWLVSFAILGGAGAACYLWRAEIMTAWPNSQRLYSALGLH